MKKAPNTFFFCTRNFHIKVQNLPFNTSKTKLQKTLSTIAPIDNIYLIKKNGICLGRAFVKLQNPEDEDKFQ